MGWAEKAWDAFRDVLRLQDKVESLSKNIELHQAKIETLNIEVAQLKVAVSILLSQSGIKDVPKIPFSPPSLPGA
ncbi:MAG: hypothetical protein ABL983_02580 [Nitrospira sp.]|jgi:hypothetical protein|nr:hypothetical protein [Nitrospirota bacterium]